MISSTEYDHLTTHQSVSAQEASAAIGFGFAVVFGLGYLTTYGVGVGKRLIGKSIGKHYEKNYLLKLLLQRLL
ncbi:hypothetical protein QW180_31310 [Vibrio sinaloensis]|nr:hypothetical protein [Vibrio sinaloensis]